jgi:L-amino acid N-acyltransferase
LRQTEIAAGASALAECPAHMGDAIEIRDASEADLPGLVAIYNDVIATSTAVYADLPVTLEERRQWWRARTAQGYPVLIARDAHGVAGFATFGDFRTWPGYRFTVGRGRSIGTRLMQALLPRAAALGKHVMIGGVDAANAASIHFHERLGFERCAHLREVGFKFDRWLDLVFLQRRI